MWFLSFWNWSEGRIWEIAEMWAGRALGCWEQSSVRVCMARTLTRIWAVKITPTEYHKGQQFHWEQSIM